MFSYGYDTFLGPFPAAFCQFDTLGHGDSCYDFSLTLDSSHDWLAADQTCKDVGMHLITLEDGLENEWLNDHLKKTGLGETLNDIGFWIGYKGKFDLLTQIQPKIQKNFENGFDCLKHLTHILPYLMLWGRIKLNFIDNI